MSSNSLVERLFNPTAVSSSRLGWVDFAKGVAIILVVYRHIVIGLGRAGVECPAFFTQLSEMINTFRMPLFFVLSGMFVRRSIQKKGSGPFVESRFTSLIYPYLIWTVIQITVQLGMGQLNLVNSERSWLDYTYIFYRPREIDHFWFIYVLFVISVFYLLLFKITKGNKLILLAVSLIMYSLHPLLQEIDIYVVQDLAWFFLYYVIGDVLADFFSDKRNHSKIGHPLLTLMLVGLFTFGQWYMLTIGNSNIYIEAATALCGTFLTFNLGFILGHRKSWRWMLVVGFHSMFVYILHVLVSSAARAVLLKGLHLNNPYLLLTVGTVLGIVVPIIFFNLTRKSMPWLFFIKLRRKSMDKPVLNTATK